MKRTHNYDIPSNLLNMSEFDIMDLRWGYKEDMWTQLLDLIKKVLNL